MRALITNDDGIDSEGIATLARAAVDEGLEVLVAAPSWDSSGASASLTGVSDQGRVRFAERELPGLPGVRALAVDATPALIARLAAHRAFGPPPDLVLSGVNHGVNTGQAVLHSGTVGAALTARTHGARAAALSLAGSPPVRWDTARAVARRTVRWLVACDGPGVLNVNVPDVAPDDLRGPTAARLASVGAVHTHVTDSGGDYVQIEHRDVRDELDPGTDAALVTAGHATVTALAPVCAADEVDLAGLIEG